MPENASSGFNSGKNPFYRKIQRQSNLGNRAKAKNLTLRYRQRVAQNQAASGQTPSFNLNAINRKLKKYGPVNSKQAQRIRKANLKRSRQSAPPPGTPGGTY